MNLLQRLRLHLALVRYDFWLDLAGVRRRHRKELRAELRANLTDAAADVGLGAALARVGSLRRLASETALAGRRTAWAAGFVVAGFAFAAMWVLFLGAALYYTEGVLDAGVDRPVESSLFPFVGSSVTVHDRTDGLSIDMSAGPGLLVVPLVAFVAAARPWRSTRRGVGR